MKFIGKEEQKKIQLHTESLEKKVTELGIELLKAQGDTAKNQAEAATALAAANQALASTQTLLDSQAQELARKTAELASAQAATAKTQQDNEAVNKSLADAQGQLAATLHALEAKNKDLPAIAAELAAAQAALNAAKAEASQAKQEADGAAAALQAQLDTATTLAAEAKAQQAAVTKELEAKAKELEAKGHELATAQAATKAAQAEASKAKQDAEAASKLAADASAQQAAATKELEAKAKELVAKSQELEAKNKDLASKAAELAGAQSAAKAAQAEASKAKQDAEVASKSAADARAQQAPSTKELEAKNKELSALKAERDKQAKLAQQTEAKYQDSAQENELLLLQLMQAQEELVEYYEQKGEFEKLYLAYKARWDRLEKRLPSYLDFGAIDIAEVDGVSDVPCITWQVKDFAQAGVALSEFSFVTVLQDGHPGIGLVKDGQPHPFAPKLLGTHKDQLANFLGLSTTEYKQLTAAVSILEQLETGQWAGFEFPKQFDLSFWRPSIKALTEQIKPLPAMLRFDEVRLKRELINPDYEHLWLEFRGLSLGAAQWKKFEIRLGAALVQADGFSQYPKFEIPLIDGKTKPFESWYAESQDDSGAKLELRFALDKKVFDVAVWSKLSEADKALVLRVIYAMPEALKRLQQQKVAIHRPWATWIDFAAGAVKVLEANKAAAKVATQAAQEVPKLANTDKSQPPAATPALAASASAAPAATLAQITPIASKAGKVISISSKPVAKPASKKPATAKKTSAIQK